MAGSAVSCVTSTIDTGSSGEAVWACPCCSMLFSDTPQSRSTAVMLAITPGRSCTARRR